ncbi:exopolyphosphatase [Shewanella sp. D64]|uniref:Ppx/GppA phosphatase family protein n=1 Tax=unclassified Shewanella TaxID=196818 RepID=UPI0022BA2E71|nr:MULTISPECIES: exopolyphosphatase [unclassified Shewanella]MEC4726153.1 exopolyphosphatase [Shewanella sp. D64]MEC4737931.1 exopolyphosphatase [Shewanella sp. E94]WBJ96132.1 exopolyphosphatase [Shewanella sp. MTB7]
MSTARYAAITLGSNSFNMLVAETLAGQPKVIAKYKRKVRLAEGIQTDGSLSEEMLLRGLDCLAMFSEMLDKEGVTADNIAVIATATFRNIVNSDDFCRRALPILDHPIEIISGMREAELIYQGMVATTAGEGRRLVIDIGGASTEFIIGDGDKVLLKTSLAVGCVTFNDKFFSSFPFQQLDFDEAKKDVKSVLGDYLSELKLLGWHCVVGASGSVQSVVELLNHRKQSTIITLDVLLALQKEVLLQTDPSMLAISGLHLERAPTFVAGVSILLALFELLDIKSLNLSGGALREGVLQMLSQQQLDNL